MKAIQFNAKVAPNGQIALPADVARQIPSGEQFQVVLLWGASSEDSEWRTAGRREFEAAYAPEDSVYDQLIDETSTG